MCVYVVFHLDVSFRKIILRTLYLDLYYTLYQVCGNVLCLKLANNTLTFSGKNNRFIVTIVFRGEA